MNKPWSDSMQPVGRSWQGQPCAEELNASSGTTVAPSTMGTIEWSSTPLPLKPPGLCLSRSLRDLRLYKRRYDTDFLPRRPLCVICRPGLSHASSWPCPLNVNHSWTHPVPKDLTPSLRAHFRFSYCILVKMAELNYLFVLPTLLWVLLRCWDFNLMVCLFLNTIFFKKKVAFKLIILKQYLSSIGTGFHF